MIARLRVRAGRDRPRTRRGHQPERTVTHVRQTLTDGERAERRKADRERLERAARELLSTDGWQRWVKIRSTNGLARYSFGNQLLIALQRPDATYVAGFRAFLRLEPVCAQGGEGDPGPRPDERPYPRQPQRVRWRRSAAHRVFRAVPVFDVAQTETLPGPSRSRWTRRHSRSPATATRT